MFSLVTPVNPHVVGDGNVAYFLREALSIIRSK